MDEAPFVTREEWKAVPPRFKKPMETPIVVFRPTTTETEECDSREACAETLRNLQDKHMNLMHLPDIKWNFMVSAQGEVFEGRGWEVEGYKNPVVKKQYGSKPVIEIGLLGNYEKDDILPQKMQSAVTTFIRQGIKSGLVSYKHTIAPMKFE